MLRKYWLGTLEEKEKERKEWGGRSVANEIELNLKGPILRLHTRDRPRKREGRITEREWVGENGMVGCNDVENREDWSS